MYQYQDVDRSQSRQVPPGGPRKFPRAFHECACLFYKIIRILHLKSMKCQLLTICAVRQSVRQ